MLRTRARRTAVGVAGLLLLAGGATAVAQEPAAAVTLPAVRGMDDLVRMSRADIELLYRASTVGTPPRGVTDGRAIFDPGSASTVRKARRTRLLWQGKVIRDDGTMINRVFGVRAFTADVYVGESWFDGQPSFIMDYKDTSKLFAAVRDEVREVSPGVWLGITYLRKDAGPKLSNFFTLTPKR